MGLIKILDIFNFIVIITVLAVIVIKIIRSGSKKLIIHLPGVLGLTVILFFEVNQTLSLYKYLIGFVALTYALVSSAYIAKIDRKKKFSAYYAFGSIFLGLFTIFTIHFGGVVNSVLTKPLFSTIMIISLSMTIIASIFSISKKKENIHFIWGMLGWVIVAAAFWIRWLGLSGEILTKLILLIGIIFLTGYFMITDCNYNRKVTS